MDHRSVDWPQLLAPNAPLPLVLNGAVSPELASVLPALDEMIACGDPDAILKRTVELARERIGLSRVAIFLRDEPNGLMRGTWGTDLEGATVDEHSVSFDIWQGDREFHQRAAREGIYWAVVENAPVIVHGPTESRVVGRGWMCCTPIRSGAEMLGAMFNDAGLSGAQLDDAKQAQGALLCSLLGTALRVAGRRGLWPDPDPVVPRSNAVAKALQLLAHDPSMTSEQLGKRLRLSASRTARVFKREMGMSLPEYRNRLRLERFSALLDRSDSNLLEVALEAGFGSYTQCYRAFLALRGTTPRAFLKARAGRQ